VAIHSIKIFIFLTWVVVVPILDLLLLMVALVSTYYLKKKDLTIKISIKHHLPRSHGLRFLSRPLNSLDLINL
jgi:hypothetical protein